ncbi:MAG: SRPBCC family protein [Acidimicrobiia bacterium]|nr:SRPBCC family protein [Acidimicrobiia bacterium]
MSTITESIDVDVDVRTAYNQWTQFEMFPAFMEGVEYVRQIDDSHNHWKVDIGGVEREFKTVITEQEPDMRIAWTTTEGPSHEGVVTVHRLEDNKCRVTLQMDYDPQGFVEVMGDAFGIVEARVRGDLERFKTFIEDVDQETGAWRGTIEQSATS